MRANKEKVTGRALNGRFSEIRFRRLIPRAQPFQQSARDLWQGVQYIDRLPLFPHDLRSED